MDNKRPEKIIVVAGPTASGKTDLAIQIAKKFNGELINADSRQIYKYLDIGTNKGKKGELGIMNQELEIGKNLFENLIDVTKIQVHVIHGVPIHLVSFLNPDQRFDLFSYKYLAILAIKNIISRGKLPILVGGTGLYIDAIAKNYLPDVSEFDSDVDLDIYESMDLAMLQQTLIEKANEVYESLNDSDKQNKRRLIRKLIKTKISDNKEEVLYNYLDQKHDMIMLYKDFQPLELEDRIKSRSREMFAEGVIEEVQSVLSLGYPQNSIALQGIGYRQILSYLNKELSYDELLEQFAISHRQYAKRQRTWFEGKGRGYDLKRVKDAGEAFGVVKDFLERG